MSRVASPLDLQHSSRPSPCALEPARNDVPALHVLLGECFQYTLDKNSLPPNKIAYINAFSKYLHDLHCHENLAFIIEIFRYEYFFEKWLPPASCRMTSDSSLASPCLNLSLDKVMDDLPHPTLAMSKHLRKPSFKSRSNVSLESAMPSTTFDLEFDGPLDPSEAWKTFSSQNILDDDSDLEPDSPTSVLTANGGDLQAVICEQWDYIMWNFIHDRAPIQVNLSDKTFRALMDSDAIKGTPQNPAVLLEAKLEVTRLLNENAYRAFVTLYRNLGHTHDSVTSSPSSMAKLCNTHTFLRKTCLNCSTPSSVHSRTHDSEPACGTHTVVAPVPKKKKSKFLLNWPSYSAIEVGSPTTAINSFISHLKTGPGSSSRNCHSSPQSPLSGTPSRTLPSMLGEVSISRPQSTVTSDGLSSSVLGTIWRRKKR